MGGGFRRSRYGASEAAVQDATKRDGKSAAEKATEAIVDQAERSVTDDEPKTEGLQALLPSW